MSKILPHTVVNVFRKQMDVAMSIYGIDCTLYVPNNMDEVEELDVYVKPSDYTYDLYYATAFIEWNPNIHRLRKLGVFAEDESPMIARFGAFQTTEHYQIDRVEIIPGSYIEVPIQFVPESMDTTQFEVVDVQLEAVHDAVSVKMWKLVPRRVKE